MTRKSIFITGAASGIGRATAQLFHARGWRVGLTDIDTEKLAEVTGALQSLNCETPVWSHPLDVTDKAQWRAAVEAFGRETGGRMDAFFNNAGIGTGGPFASVPEDKSRAVIDINVRGVISGLYACFPLLKATPGATVVNTASTAGMYGVPDLAVYAASKHAVRGLTEALDIEWSRHGIHVCDLMPWLIDTPILDNIGSDSNRSLRDRATAGRQPIYPVTDVAEEVWRAVERRDRLHRPVGKMAHRTKFFAWHMPDALRKRMAQQRDA